MPVTQIMTIVGRSATAAPSVVNLMTLDAASYSGSGTTWSDTSGQNNNGTLVNSPAYHSTVPKYFTFDRASTQFVQGPALPSLDKWTMETWFRLSEPLSNTAFTSIITTTYEDGNGTLYGHINYTLSNYLENVDNAHLTVGFYNGSWHTTNGFIPEVGRWYHVVGTYDGTTLQQWLNGQFLNETTVGSASLSNGGPVRVARRWDGLVDDATQFFPGDIAVAKIYSGVMSNTDISTAYSSTRNTYSDIVTTNLLFDLDMKNYVSGTAWPDASGANNNFAFTGTPTVVNGGTPTAYWDNTSNVLSATTGGANILPVGSYTKGVVLWSTGSNGTGNILSSITGQDVFWTAGTDTLNAGHNGAWTQVTGNTPIPTGAWTYVAVTFDTTSGWTLYQNGEVIGTNSDTTVFGGGSSEPNIGGFVGGYQFTGKFAAAHEYTRALSQSEIQRNYNYYLTRYSGSTPA